MRTTLTIDDSIFQQLMQFSGKANAVEAVRLAIDAYLRQARKEKALALRGKVDIQDDWRALRGRELTAAQLETDASQKRAS